MSGKYALIIAELRLQRDVLDQTIKNLEVLGGATLPPTPALAMSAMQVTKSLRRAKAKRREEPSGTDSADGQSLVILDALKKAARPVSVGELKRSTKLSSYLLNNRLTALSAKRRVVITGATSGKRVALPGTTPAKEEP